MHKEHAQAALLASLLRKLQKLPSACLLVAAAVVAVVVCRLQERLGKCAAFLQRALAQQRIADHQQGTACSCAFVFLCDGLLLLMLFLLGLLFWQALFVAVVGLAAAVAVAVVAAVEEVVWLLAKKQIGALLVRTLRRPMAKACLCWASSDWASS